VVTSITVPLHPGCNACNYMHYMTNYMLPKMLMQGELNGNQKDHDKTSFFQIHYLNQHSS
jgi:hypothetical protein